MKIKKKTAANEQFGASGGAVSSDTEQVTSSFALVQTFPNPPPAAKLPLICKSADSAVRTATENKVESSMDCRRIWKINEKLKIIK